MNLVIGSVNVDFTLKVDRFPSEGETITGAKLYISAGGKGLNQAVASARAGAETQFVGCAGKDLLFEFIKSALAEEKNIKLNIRVDDEERTGTAFIIVDRNGKNKIVVSPGANRKLFPQDVERYIKELKPSHVILQCELEYEVVSTAMWVAKHQGARIFLNTAPFRAWVKDIYHMADFLILNESEAELLSGEVIKDMQVALDVASHISQLSGNSVLITLGKMGGVFVSQKERLTYRAFDVNAVDTTAAGDTFTGFFSACLLKNYSIPDALIFASAASALCVSREGAINSIPKRDDVLNFLQKI